MRPYRISVPGVADIPSPEDLMTDVQLPDKPRFFKVHGLPVSFGKVPGCIYRCAQWSDGRPEMFSEAAVHSYGEEITEQAFRELIQLHKLEY